MAPLPLVPRPLNADERAVLEHILSTEFTGAPQLRSQLDRTEVIAVWGPGSVSVDLRVREPCEHAALPEALVPVDAPVHDPSGAYVGEVLVWTDRGATLAALEFAWITDEMPTSLPAVMDGRLGRPVRRTGPTLSARGPAADEIAT
ncbi:MULTISPECIES: hypothetical protein [unclassified Streptomyces]|uniref:hypothetical protein n=1 Tax=unclassified Streptomyces TaxID=2593676 RepID=UPI0006AF7247|nr:MULTISPECIES: hypothetical protein [unclassified Streptomyces]